MKKGLVAGVIGLLLVSGVGVVASRWAPREPVGGIVKVVILPGAKGAEIADLLAAKRVVSSALAFRIYLRFAGIEGELKAGEYDLEKEMGFGDLVDILRKGPAIKYVKLVIPEGLNVDQTAERVGLQTHITKQEFLEAATTATIKPALVSQIGDPGILPRTAPGTLTLEGFLYPKTYYVSEKETAVSLVKRLVGQFEKETNSVDWTASSQFGQSPYQVLVIASLIEKEAKVEEDRPLISAVIHNRLKKGMRLEIDATVQYLVNKYRGQPLTQSDLNFDSPYNTRRYPGIPPGPLASPRIESIEAALHPASSNALYFVLKPDCRTHEFTADYNAFLRARQRQPANC